jgi:hypothetical protein
VAEGEARTGLHEPGVALGDRDGDAGGNQGPGAGLEVDRRARRQVVARVTRVLTRGERYIGIEAANTNAELDAGRISTTGPGDP